MFGSDRRAVAGCMVNEGVMRKGAVVVVKRGKRVVYDGPLSSLRRVKDIVNEVRHLEALALSSSALRPRMLCCAA